MKTFSLFALHALVVLALSAGGCATAPSVSPAVMRLPPSVAVRAGMGSVTVVMRSDERGPMEYYQPVGSDDIKRATIPNLSMADLAGAGEGVLILIPVMAAIGLLNVGIANTPVPGDSAAELQKAVGTLAPVLTELKISGFLGQRVIALARANTVAAVRSYESDSGISYAKLADTDFGTILELTTEKASLGPDGSNQSSGAALTLTAQVRLVDARTGRELYYDRLGHRSPSRRLSMWAANQGQPLRDAAATGVLVLAEEIVAQLFTRPSGEPVSAAQLARSGLFRLPSAPGHKSGTLAVIYPERIAESDDPPLPAGLLARALAAARQNPAVGEKVLAALIDSTALTPVLADADRGDGPPADARLEIRSLGLRFSPRPERADKFTLALTAAVTLRQAGGALLWAEELRVESDSADLETWADYLPLVHDTLRRSLAAKIAAGAASHYRPM